MNKLFIPLRLSSILFVIFIYFFIALVMPYLSRSIVSHISKFWAKSILFGLGIKVIITGDNKNGNYISPNSMVVANHISWIDIPLLYSVRLVSFIGKIEMLRWPFLKTLIKGGGTIFIDRGKKRELIKINEQVSKKLCEGATIGLFPEGRTGSGDIVLPFKAPILESAIMAKSNIIPIVIEYLRSDGSRATEVSSAGKIPMWKVLIRVLSLKGVYARITLLPNFAAGDFDTREQLAAKLYNEFESVYNKNNL